GSTTLTGVLDRAFPTAASAGPASASVIRAAIDGSAEPGDPAPDQLLAGPPLEGAGYPEAVAAPRAALAAALAFLPDRRLAPRGLKPSNVLLTPGGRPMLLDFNLSRDARGGRGLFGGTFAYMAPEAIQAWIDRAPLPAEAAARADLFSLGALLYELLSGDLPAGAPPPDEPAAMARSALKTLEQPPVPLRERNPAVPAWMAAVIEQCLALAPEQRPAGAAAIASALRPARPRRSRRRWLVSLASAAVLA